MPDREIQVVLYRKYRRDYCLCVNFGFAKTCLQRLVDNNKIQQNCIREYLNSGFRSQLIWSVVRIETA